MEGSRIRYSPPLRNLLVSLMESDQHPARARKIVQVSQPVNTISLLLVGMSVTLEEVTLVRDIFGINGE
jgi:hypothetical protein